MTTGIDIVKEQIRIAQGEPLALKQSDIARSGHAVEFRINAEDPNTFAPSPGTVTRWDVPGGIGIRVDSHIAAGASVPRHYDSLIGKLIAHGATREEALARARVALSELRAEGIRTNVPLHQAILADPAFCEGGYDIHHLEHWMKARAAAQ
jgi:acetyl-CoA carboxylase biotin carboxylase subunit